MSIESLLIPKSSAPMHYLRSLDEQIKHILNDKKLASDVKYHLYSQVLNKWNDVQENMRKPTKIAVNKNESKPEYELYDNIPKTALKKAKKLMNFINNLANVSITPDGSLSIDGREVINSNISTILSHFVLNTKASAPIGAKQLAQELKFNNVPIEIIGNKNRHTWFVDTKSPERFNKNRKSMIDDSKSPEIYNNKWTNY